MVVALASSPVNELLVVELTDQSASRIRGANFRVKLAHPALSPDGRRLAMVATPPTYFGIAEIWVLDLETSSLVRIGESQRAYDYPTFSHDGTRLLYFAETAHPQASQPTPMQPEYRALAIDYHLAEFEFSTHSERTVATAHSTPRLWCGSFRTVNAEWRTTVRAGDPAWPANSASHDRATGNGFASVAQRKSIAEGPCALFHCGSARAVLFCSAFSNASQRMYSPVSFLASW